MTKPVRIQLSRRKGFDLQEHSRSINGLECVSVARPGPFGNPFVVGKDGDAGYCVDLFARMLVGDLAIGKSVPVPLLRERRAVILDRLPDLRGKNLACFCKPGARCHADVLLDLANGGGDAA